MPRLNRRNFLQISSAAGLVPVLPPVSMGAAVSYTPSTSQLLWTAMLKRANTAPKLAALSKTMGLSGRAAIGVSTQLAGAKLITSEVANSIGTHASQASAGNVRSFFGPKSKKLQKDFVQFLKHEMQNAAEEARFLEDDISLN